MKKTNLKNGIISLTTVLAVSAILIASGLTLLITAVDFSKNTSDFDSGVEASIRIRTCLEESLNKLKLNHAFNGTFTVTYTDGSCTAIISNDGSDPTNIRNIAINSSYSGFFSAKTYLVNVSVSPFTVVS